MRGGSGVVQVLAGNGIIAEHPRHAAQRLVIDPAYYERESTDRVQAPTPLDHLGQRLQELTQIPVEHRPLDLVLAEVGR